MTFNETFFLRYLDLGWSPFPIVSRTKFPPEGFAWSRYQGKRAGRNQIRDWVTRWSTLSIGIVTGDISGIFVIDVDTAGPRMLKLKVEDPGRYHAAIEFISDLTASFPPTACAHTAHGRHYYFRLPKGLALGNKIGFRDGLDLKGQGGYVLAPPSVHPDGPSYVWDRTPESGIADPPQRLLELLSTARGVLESTPVGGSSHWTSILAGVVEGQRNASAAQLAGLLLARVPQEAWLLAWEFLVTWNRRNDPPMREQELRTTFDSIRKRELSKTEVEAVHPMNAADFEGVDFPEPGYAVKNMLIDGITLLVAQPKVGKSILSMQIALAVCRGATPWASSAAALALYGAFETTRGSVLYLALEDSKARVIRRARGLLNGAPLPDNFYFQTDWPGLYDGGITAINRWLESHPDTRLVVIDTLAAFLGEREKTGTAFQVQYRMIRPIWEVARARSVPILIIHHSSKGKGKGANSVENVSGTLGLPASADTFMEMTRADRSTTATLKGLGRDVESFELSLEQPRHTLIWHPICLPPNGKRSKML